MRTAAFLREVSRNLASGTSRVGLFASVATVVLSLVVLSELLNIVATVRQGIEYREAGAAVVTLSLPQRIDGRACEALGDSPNVVAAGAMREAEQVTLSTFPSSPLRQYVTTPSFPQVLQSADHGHGAYFSEEVAASVGERSVLIAETMVPIRGDFAYPADGRRAGFGWAMLSPTGTTGQLFDECWVQMWPERNDIRQLLLTTLTARSSALPGEEPLISQLNTRLGAVFTGVDSYADRPTRFAGPLALLAAIFLALISVWSRRIEIAANLHAGSSRWVLSAQFMIETIAWALPAALCGWAAGCVTAGIGAPMELSSLATRSGQVALLFLVGSLIGSVAGTLFVREARLWSYVRGR